MVTVLESVLFHSLVVLLFEVHKVIGNPERCGTGSGCKRLRYIQRAPAELDPCSSARFDPKPLALGCSRTLPWPHYHSNCLCGSCWPSIHAVAAAGGTLHWHIARPDQN